MILDYPAGAQSHHWHPYKRDAEGDEMEMHREEGNLKAEAGTGEMWPQVTEHLEPPKTGKEQTNNRFSPKNLPRDSPPTTKASERRVFLLIP